MTKWFMCIHIHMTKVRQDFTLEKDNILLLQKVVKESFKHGKKESMSSLIDFLISNHLRNPIDKLRAECKELQLQIVAKQDRIKSLEQVKEAKS